MCHYTPTCTQMRKYMYLFVHMYVHLDGNIETSFPPFYDEEFSSKILLLKLLPSISLSLFVYFIFVALVVAQVTSRAAFSSLALLA